MTVASCIYEGSLTHERRGTIPHRFSYGVFMLYLDLAELPDLFHGRWLWSSSRPNLAWFRRADHLGDQSRPLADEVRGLVAATIGHRPSGPVRLLTHLRYLGLGFNPISIYFCHDADQRLAAAVCEVTNTPWGDRHNYVIDLRGMANAPGQRRTGSFAKQMHVSPFQPADLTYRWALEEPDRDLTFSITCWKGEQRVLTAGLTLHRRPLDASTMRRMLVRYPPMSLVALGGIYWQALRLWLKGAPYHAHPRRDTADACPAAQKDAA